MNGNERRENLSHSSFSAVPRDFAALSNFLKPCCSTVFTCIRQKAQVLNAKHNYYEWAPPHVTRYVTQKTPYHMFSAFCKHVRTRLVGEVPCQTPPLIHSSQKGGTIHICPFNSLSPTLHQGEELCHTPNPPSNPHAFHVTCRRYHVTLIPQTPLPTLHVGEGPRGHTPELPDSHKQGMVHPCIITTHHQPNCLCAGGGISTNT